MGIHHHQGEEVPENVLNSSVEKLSVANDCRTSSTNFGNKMVRHHTGLCQSFSSMTDVNIFQEDLKVCIFHAQYVVEGSEHGGNSPINVKIFDNLTRSWCVHFLSCAIQDFQVKSDMFRFIYWPGQDNPDCSWYEAYPCGRPFSYSSEQRYDIDC